jgi:hypothetical protein
MHRKMKTQQNCMKKIVAVFLLLGLVACNNNNKQLPNQPMLLHTNQNNLTDLIVYDIFSPPVAARIYAYTSLAAHEALRHIQPNEPSIVQQLKGFASMPVPDSSKQYNFELAAATAFYTVAGQMTFSKNILQQFQQQAMQVFQQSLSNQVYQNSIDFGGQVAAVIMQRAAADNYKQTRAMEKYFGSKAPGKWQPTSPDYLDATEPYWNQLHSFIADSNSQFDPGAPPLFSTAAGSDFYKMNKEVFTTGNQLTQEQKDIARFWDDNPFVMEHAGHLMAATKKQTPGGHWMGIATIACRQTNADVLTIARTYALTALALFEGFISVFDTKYRYAYVRPITFINQYIDKNWEPYLQTPPFPEYTSGHSTITGSAATVLTQLFGDHFAFNDTSDKRYINMERTFSSFIQASDECSISRLYGGIHYRMSVDRGAAAGKKIGQLIVSKFIKK